MSTELKQVNKLKKTGRRNDNLNDNKFVETKETCFILNLALILGF